jgi:hypothetical protein
MEEFIYILIGVIWLGASIYKATQKGKQKTGQQKHGSPQTQEGQRVPGARSILEELLSGQQVTVPEPESIDISYEDSSLMEMEQAQPTKSFQSEYADFGLRGLETLSGERENSLGGIVFKDELKEVTKKGPGQNTINLRKAIIYSAILERPYI